MKMLYRNDDMLLRIAQADAYALAVEYVSRKKHPQLFEDVLKFEKFHRNPERQHTSLSAGSYSDDTQMSISVAETLIANVEPLTSSLLSLHDHQRIKQEFSNGFYEAFKRDPRDGYSRAFQAILEQSTSADHMRSLIVPTSVANGAAMRSVPLGVVPNDSQIYWLASTQASITHDNWGGMSSSRAIALMSYYALYMPTDFSKMHQWCCLVDPTFQLFEKPWKGGVGLKNNMGEGWGIGIQTAWAVHTLLTTKTSLMDILRQVIEWRGDTDSVAAIAWGIASCRYQDEVLPSFLTTDLEPHTQFGVKFLKDLGKKLMDTYEEAV